MIDGISIFNCKNSRQSHFFFHFIIVTGIQIAVTDTNSCPHTHSLYQAALKSFTLAAYKESVLVAVIIVPLLIRIKREREIRVHFSQDSLCPDTTSLSPLSAINTNSLFPMIQIGNCEYKCDADWRERDEGSGTRFESMRRRLLSRYVHFQLENGSRLKS